MRKTLSMAALAALIAAPLIAGATDASASCQGRKDTGTALGAVGGALLGNSISRGGGGAVVGGLGGAVVGHQIAKSGCGPSRQAYYRPNSRYARGSNYYGRGNGYDRGYTSRGYYYDEHGNRIYR
jgi:hypothetical protein